MKKYLITFCLTIAFALSGFGQNLIEWDTSGIAGGLTDNDVPQTLASSANSTNIEPSVMTAGSGLTAWGYFDTKQTDAERFQFAGWNAGPDSYIEFTVAAAAGHQFTVTGIEYHYRARGGSTQAHTANIYSSLDGFTSPVGSVAVAAGNSSPGQQLSFVISGVTDESSVTFRLMHEGGDPALDTWRPLGLYGSLGPDDVEFAVVGTVFEAVSDWYGFSIDEAGWVDTGSWMGMVNVIHDPWVYVNDLGHYLYIPSDAGWAWVPGS